MYRCFQKVKDPSSREVLGEKVIDAVNAVADNLHEHDKESKKRYFLSFC